MNNENIAIINIPKDATNGDVLKMLFPPSVYYGDDEKHIMLLTKNCELTCLNNEWWNAPYKAEGEVKKMDEKITWIDVKNELPKKEGYYLVTVAGYVRTYFYNLKSKKWYGGAHNEDGDPIENTLVTAWANLPAPFDAK